MKKKETLYWQSLEEVRQGYKEGSHSHDQTTNSNQSGTMELGTKVAHKGDDEQVACREELKITKNDYGMNQWTATVFARHESSAVCLSCFKYNITWNLCFVVNKLDKFL